MRVVHKPLKRIKEIYIPLIQDVKYLGMLHLLLMPMYLLCSGLKCILYIKIIEMNKIEIDQRSN